MTILGLTPVMAYKRAMLDVKIKGEGWVNMFKEKRKSNLQAFMTSMNLLTTDPEPG